MKPIHGANARALLTFHHIISTRKKRTIRKAALDLEVYGICKVGYPGILAVEGTEEKVGKYVREIKVCSNLHLFIWRLLIFSPCQSLRWASCTLTNLTRDLSEADLRMVEARRTASKGAGVDMLEKMSEVGAYMRQVGLEDWWRSSMGYKGGPG